MFKKLKYFTIELYHSILNLIYNKKCLICSCAKENVLLCKTCSKDVEYLSLFAHRIFEGIPIYSAVYYEGVIKKLIHQLKFQHKKSAAIPLAQILFKYFKNLELKNDFIIVYPSGFYLRNIQRGYCPIHLIIKEFSKLSQIDFIKDFIIKSRYTKPQYKSKNKKKNILDSFKINKKKLINFENKTVLLIDDITTSGATLEELIKVLKNENIKDIICLTLAKSKK